MSDEQAAVDLTNCDREPIQIPGSVQPHGVLLVVREPELRVIQVTANVEAILGRSANALLGASLKDLLTAEYLDLLQRQVLPKDLEGNPTYLAPFRIQGVGDLFEGSIHRHDGVLLLQLEPPLPVSADARALDAFASTHRALDDLRRARTVAEFSELAAHAVRAQTDYDRVVVYRFLEDDTGEVIGESKHADLPTWISLRFPASDIPKQARALYLQSRLRIIADTNSVPAPLIPALNPLTDRPLDMSFCVLRSVSPIHIQYLKNMRVQGSMSLSLIHEGKLWGLIACHHNQPKRLSQQARIACEFLADSFSLQIGAKHEKETQGYVRKLQREVLSLTNGMSNDLPVHESLAGLIPNLRGLFRATGVAVVLADGMHARGLTPSEEQIRSLTEWLKQQIFRDGVYASSGLPGIYPEAIAFRSKASGVLAIQVEDPHLKWLLWFRQEVLQVVNWAGNPEKPVTVDTAGGMARLSPRNSFALWREEKQGTSEPWWPVEVNAAIDLRRSLLEIAARRVESLTSANADLAQSNGELESFAYAAGHDLKTPLRGISFYSHLLERSLKPQLSEQQQQQFASVRDLTKRMDQLIDSLLDYARVGQLDLNMQDIDGDDMLRAVLAMLEPQLQARQVKVRPLPLGGMRGDLVRLRELYQNLISNASKYNDKAEKWIEIGYVDGDPRAYYVKDNGIGIAERNYEAIFDIFKRLHEENDYGGGTGAGLTIARKIVERHQGRIWVESRDGIGSTFYFTLTHA